MAKKKFKSLSESKLYGYAGCNPELQEDLSNVPKTEHENWMCVYPEKDIKEFIKIIEEIVTRRCKGTSANCYEIKKEIKERTGPKLITKS